MLITGRDSNLWSVIKRQTSQTTSDYEWLLVTTTDYEPDYEWLQVTTSDYEPDYEWLQVTTSQRATTSQTMIKTPQLGVKGIFTS